MAITTQWLMKSHIIYSVITDDNAHAEDVIDMAEQVHHMLRVGKAPVHWIVDVSNQSQMTMDIKASMQQFSFLRNNSRFGWAVLVGNERSRVVSFVASTTAQLLGTRLRIVSSQKEAFQFLSDQDDRISIHDLDYAMRHVAG